jgi:tetratricopeptide (TPR) repeat protein
MGSRVILADAFHQAGLLDDAEALFREAEIMQKEQQPELPLLYTFQGYKYCNLLLDREKYVEIDRRANQTLEWAKIFDLGFLAIALDNLSLGRAHLMQAQGAKKPDFTQAAAHLEGAVTGLRQAGTQHELPRGLLAHAELWCAMKEYDKAQADLDEAYTITTRGGMRLYEADCHLGYARLYIAKDEKDKAHEHWEKAKEMIDEMGYHRRDGEVEELEKELQ